MFFSGIGLVATFVTCHIFIRHNDTPVVKASTRELSYLILAGMTLAHIAVFPILAKPTRITCALSRLMPGISFAMMYASLFTKTNRIARILAGSKKRFPKRKPMFMSATAQVVITCVLITVEAGVAAAMLVIEPPMPRSEYPAYDRAVLTCATSPRAVLSPLAFDGLLVALCTLYAVKTRNVPENFNEAKFIGFAMYTTCVIWIAFGPIYFGSESKVVTMCMCVTLSASVTLVFLFLPKLYIIVLRPERNNRALFTTSKSIRCHIGARVAAAIAEPPAKQAIYRLATGDSDITARRSSVSRRTLSVQTGAELLVDLCKSRNDRSTSPMAGSPVRPDRPDSPSGSWRCRYDERICRSSDNVEIGDGSEPSYLRRSHEKSCTGARSLGSCLSLFVGRRDGSSRALDRSDERLPKWLELDAKVLMTDPRNGEYSKAQTNGKTGNGLVTHRRTDNQSTSGRDDGRVCGFPLGERTRIREERAGRFSSNGEPVINITITLGTDIPELRELTQSTV